MLTSSLVTSLVKKIDTEKEIMEAQRPFKRQRFVNFLMTAFDEKEKEIWHTGQMEVILLRTVVY